MGWELDKKRPLCPQICEQICVMISKGDLKPGQRLMSVREVALAASVTPNTVQKSFEQLEQKGVIYSRRGSGWYVAENNDIASGMRKDLIRTKTEGYVTDLRSLGLDDAEILNCVKEFIHE